MAATSSPEDAVRSWLASLNLGQYAQQFIELGLLSLIFVSSPPLLAAPYPLCPISYDDPSMIHALDKSDLDEMNITLPGHRKRILLNAPNYNPQQVAQALLAAPTPVPSAATALPPTPAPTPAPTSVSAPVPDEAAPPAASQPESEPEAEPQPSASTASEANGAPEYAIATPETIPGENEDDLEASASQSPVASSAPVPVEAKRPPPPAGRKPPPPKPAPRPKPRMSSGSVAPAEDPPAPPTTKAAPPASPKAASTVGSQPQEAPPALPKANKPSLVPSEPAPEPPAPVNPIPAEPAPARPPAPQPTPPAEPISRRPPAALPDSQAGETIRERAPLPDPTPASDSLDEVEEERDAVPSLPSRPPAAAPPSLPKRPSSEMITPTVPPQLPSRPLSTAVETAPPKLPQRPMSMAPAGASGSAGDAPSLPQRNVSQAQAVQPPAVPTTPRPKSMIQVDQPASDEETIFLLGESNGVFTKNAVNIFTTAGELLQNYLLETKSPSDSTTHEWQLWEVLECPPVERQLAAHERILEVKSRWPKHFESKLIVRFVANELVGSPSRQLQGQLYKRGGTRKTWKSRFCVLQDTAIAYYQKQPKTLAEIEKPLGTFVFVNALVYNVRNYKRAPKSSLCYCIRPLDDGVFWPGETEKEVVDFWDNHCKFMCAYSAKERATWVASIIQAQQDLIDKGEIYGSLDGPPVPQSIDNDVEDEEAPAPEEPVPETVEDASEAASSPPAVDAMPTSSEPGEGTCLFFREWHRRDEPPRAEPPLSEQHLMYGMILSIKQFVNKISPVTETGIEFGSYATETYRLHFMETASKLKFVITTDLQTQNMRDILRSIHTELFVPYIAGTPTLDVGQPIKSSGFEASLDAKIKGLPFYSS
ncbi:uncharacterized protein MONBRDRAFT_29641 [Monosiga brevicollis MX1]|uniref:PH domain-containing protein n=1 Tax=Monosiga brevicollis TaxID=81824 RepID=A9VBP9_MONBE|nr:uncharacterized protein MONBRDRAFT_29641 [Monosiga brevicollis MX1]EDQ85015.1 predicted protein [Monosiga brevicollis MX1]|eukprot:XP_001750185.1 hypothetical protein [Monosiga brevicollis MX1]